MQLILNASYYSKHSKISLVFKDSIEDDFDSKPFWITAKAIFQWILWNIFLSFAMQLGRCMIIQHQSLMVKSGLMPLLQVWVFLICSSNGVQKVFKSTVIVREYVILKNTITLERTKQIEIDPKFIPESAKAKTQRTMYLAWVIVREHSSDILYSIHNKAKYCMNSL